MDTDNEGERAYLQRRAAMHRASATAAREESARALHERFATLYAERAELLVQDD